MDTYILVTGSRNWSDAEVIYDALYSHAEFLAGELQIVHGGARGADACAGLAARRLEITEHVVVAQWDRYGRSAGFKRNVEMIESFPIDMVLAFKDGLDMTLSSGGTEHMIRTALTKRVPVRWCGGTARMFRPITSAESAEAFS